MKRRRFLALIGAAAASGCAGSYFGNAVSALGELRERKQRYPRSRAEVDAIPYASLGVQLEGGLKTILVLAHYDADRLIWVSANRESLVTRHGRVVRTVGLSVDLMGVWAEGHDPLREPASDPAAPYRDRRDYQAGSEFEPGVSLASSLRFAGTEEIEILERRQVLDRWTETVEVPKWKWRRENRYWIARDDGYVWRSVQWLHRDLPPLVLETLKKPA